MKSPDGQMNVAQMCKGDAVMAELLNDGWTWTVIPFHVEEKWPGLPSLAQAALNADHASYNRSSELEVAMMLANVSGATTGNEPLNWKFAIETAKVNQPPCLAYVEALEQLVRLYGGGVGCPLIKFLDRFSKAYGENRLLGETFTRGSWR